MPIGGETIGRAYIRVLADGSGFDDDIRRQLRRVDPTMEAAGERHSEAYRRGFQSGMPGDDEDPLESFEEALEHGRGRYNRIGELLGGNLLQGMRDELNASFPDVGDQITENLRDAMARGDIGEVELIARLKNVRRDVAQAGQDIARRQAEQFSELEAAVERYGNTLVKTRNARISMQRDLDAFQRILPEAVTDTDKFRLSVQRMSDILAPTGNRLAQMRDMFRNTGDTVGRVFGRGSRNNFLNFFGGFVSLAPRLIGGLSGVATGFQGFGRAMRAAWQEGDNFRESLGNVITGLGSVAKAGLPGVVAAIIGVGAAIQVVSVLLPAFGAAISLVSGLVLALAGSLGFALVGGLVAAAGALFPFAAAAGVAALAMAGLNKESEAFKDLKSDWESLQKAAAKKVFGADGAGLKSLQSILAAVRPLILDVAEAVGKMLTAFATATGTKEFAKLMEDVGAAITPMVETLGKIGGNLTVGLLQVFRDASPLIQQFLDWVLKLTEGLNNAGKGGDFTPLVQFLIDAGESARIVGGLIMDIVEAVGILLSAGKGTGDSIFASIATQVQEIVKWLSSSEGQKALQQWFADAEKLAGALGRVGLKVIAFVDALDTPESRLALLRILGAIEWIIGALIKAANAMNWWLGLVQGFGQAFVNAIAGLPGALSGIWSALLTAGSSFLVTLQNMWSVAIGWLTTQWQNIVAGAQIAWTNLTTGVANVISVVTTFFSTLWTNLTTGVSLAVNNITTWFAGLPVRISAALGDMGSRFTTWLSSLPARASQTVTSVVTGFTNLAGRIIAGLGNLASRFATWVSTLPGKAKAIATQVAQGFVGLAGSIITKAGNIASRIASWFSSLPGKAKTIATQVASGFSGLAANMIAKAGSIAAKFASWAAGVPGAAAKVAKSIASAFSGLAKDAMAKAGSITSAIGSWASGVYRSAKGVANDIVDAFRGLASDIVNAIGNIVPKIKMPNIPRPTVEAIVKVIKPKAAGGIIRSPEVALLGEAGPEAVVPLHRSLSQVDPAVRALSAIAQGLRMPGDTGGGPSIGRQIDVGGITINTPTTDPRAVASEVVTRMTHAAYI